MTSSHTFLLLLFGSLFGGHLTGVAQTLESSVVAKKWKRRVVLIYAQDAQNKELLSQQKLLAAQQAGLTLRDIDVLLAIESDLSASDRTYLRSNGFKLPASTTFETYLIGKDGGVKQRFSKPVTATELFRIIDAMPMRQSEMRRKQ